VRNSEAPSAEVLLEKRAEYALKTSLEDRQWKCFSQADGSVAIGTSAVSPYLFRGQNKCYQPCLSNLARGLASGIQVIPSLPVEDQARLVDLLARRVWFLREIERHPASRWMVERKIDQFKMALVQHYGIPTGYIDLTESFDVACFFATCYEDPRDKSWQPCVDGEGVIYRLPTRRLAIRPDVLQPIGLQPFPRPREQWAWVLVTGIGLDFESVKGVEPLAFRHVCRVSEYFLEKFCGGSTLFPPDILARIADDVMSSRVLPRAVLDRTLHDLSADSRGVSASAGEILKELAELGVSGGEVSSLLTAEEEHRLETDWTRNREHFLLKSGLER
jgi:FRG domain-containing protein